MIDAVALQVKIISLPDNIFIILEALGFFPKDRGKYVSFPNKDGDNLNACVIYKDTLAYTNYTRGHGGNIFTLIMDERGLSFGQALKWVSDLLGYTKEIERKEIKYPFGGFYRKMIKDRESPELSMKIYSESDLPEPNSLSLKWLREGVSLQVQEAAGIRYDHESDRIIIPERSFTGDLVGAKARSNVPDCPLNQRWSMYIPYSKTMVLYPYHLNYKNIARKKLLIIMESEKATLQALSFGCGQVLSIGGHNISKVQAKYIKSLMCDRIVIAFDEGIEEELIREEAKKLIVDNVIYKNKVGYIWESSEKSNRILLPGSKDNIADVGKKGFAESLKKNVRWIN